MKHDFGRSRNHRAALLRSPAVKWLMGLVICVLIPLLATTSTLPEGWSEREALTTAIASALSLTVGFWLHQSISRLPGTAESGGILPSYLGSYGLAFFVIIFFRIDYSRAILLSGVILTTIWFFAAYMMTQRTSLSLGVVTGGRTERFDAMHNVVAHRLTLDDFPFNMDAVVADFHVNHGKEWEARLADYVLAGIPVYHSRDLIESLTGRAEIEHLSENNFGTLAPTRSLLRVKRIVDWLMAALALVPLLPVFGIVAILIKLNSPGPILFRQDRIGYRGRVFTCIKFRTMKAEASSTGLSERAELITLSNDRRVTRFGRWLRRTRIDELPQVINILRGEMSWIGPRPEAAKLSEWYKNEVPFYRYRHVVVPGITGWAQVSQGHVAELDDVRKKLQFDFYYIRNFSLWLDILIIAKTIKTMASGYGSK